MKTSHTGLKRILYAFMYSYHGFKAAFKSEVAFRQDLFFCALMSIGALSLDISVWQKGYLISSLLVILLMELVNTAIETIIDRISDDYHELSKKAKDIGSLLVFLSFIFVAIVWGATLYSCF